MTSPLDTDVTIKTGGEFLRLRPSLRHAMRLEARDGSFSKLISDLSESSLSAALFILEPFDPYPVKGQLGFAILESGLGKICNQLHAYVLHCAGIDQSVLQSDGKGEYVTFREQLAQLYRWGTGWLGWAPQETLEATPNEIKQAYLGRIELLKAIFGTSESPKSEGDLSEKLKTVLTDIGKSPDHKIIKAKRKRKVEIMPFAAPHICTCGRIVKAGERCACQKARDHERHVRFDQTRPSARQRGYTAKWDEARAVFLAANPYCAWEGCNARATAVDHVKPHKGNTKLLWDRKNWQPLCQHHHNSAKHRIECKAMP